MPPSSSELLVRFKSLLPSRWFGDETPVLDALIGAMTSGWEFVFQSIDYVSRQSRIGTSTDMWLDLSGQDFLGPRFARRGRETDNSFRNRLLFELNKDRCTRQAMVRCIEHVTGRVPDVFEPANPGDTGCYASASGLSHGAIGYGSSGGWGSLTMPFQAFVRVRRPLPAGAGMVSGWGTASLSFGGGLSAYTGTPSLDRPISDADIMREISSVAPAGSCIWVAILP